MWGKKARVYYHGIPLFCSICYSIGHNNLNCDNKTASWKDYIDDLRDSGIPSEIFGPWLTSNLSSTRDCNAEIAQPQLASSDESDSDSDSGEEIDVKKLPPKYLKLFKKLQASTPKSSKKEKAKAKASSKKKVEKEREKKDPTPPPSRSESNRGVRRRRGRGRGN